MAAENRGFVQGLYESLRDRPAFLKKLEKWSENSDKDSAAEADPNGNPAASKGPDKGGKPADIEKERVSISVGRREVAVDVRHGCCCSGEAAKDEHKEDAGNKGDPLGSGILKVAGAAATSIGAVGAIVAVGAAVLWIRFNEAGIPAIQAISVQPKYEALVQGGQETVVFLLIALIATLLIFFTDPCGVIRRITIWTLLGLFVIASLSALSTHLTPWAKVGLIVLALVLVLGSIVIGTRTQNRFWPLGLAVFISSLIFSSASALLIAEQQDFVQAVAVLRSGEDAGLTGVYVAATEKTLYIAKPAPIPTDGSPKLAMMDIPREGTSYAVGPLESQAKARQRAGVMLARLVEARERNPAPETPESGEEDAAEEASTEGKGSTEATPSKESSAAAPAAAGPSIEQVLQAFRPRVHVEPRAAKGACLVRYGDASSTTAAGNWWTSCKEAEQLKTIAEVRERLALPPGRFQGAYDLKIEATLPAGARVLIVRGRAASQCQHEAGFCGRRYPGGGVQYWVAQPQQLSIHGRSCSAAAEDAPSAWGSCAG